MKETGFLKLTSESSNPELMLSLIIKATKASDKIMRQRYVDFSTEPLAFYKEQASYSALSRTPRGFSRAYNGEEEQKLMFASRGKYFIAEPYIKPYNKFKPTAPKPKLIFALSLILGSFIGAALVLIRH